MKTLILLTIVTLFVTAETQAQSSSGSGGSRPWLLSQSAAARESKRFTLQEWLENKERRNMMDMWLSMNTPTPYEFVIGGSLQSYRLDTTTGGVNTSQSYNTINGEVSAYAKFIGLSLEHTNNAEEKFNDTTGIFNLRVFGNTVQGSHLTLHYGLRTRTANNGSYRLNQTFPAVTLQLYIMKYFGIQGNYRGFTPVTESFYGETSADELTYGAFIEYGALRLFGDVYQERQNSKLNNVETNYKREGARVGLKLYF
ncbi:hypothetical protein K2P97_12225 [bacterium]|nr:hypothetical protein [bacterium]